ncbi:MAG: hypothetical protein GXY42_03580 [Desulfovibrionales bacterium]|nr:hypothetical protein [Desulfovibrionales bacterium]
MKGTCPTCGSYGPLESFLVDDDAKRAVVAVGKLPGDLPRICWAYLGLFRKPESPRVLTWERVGRIVAELAELVAEKDMSWKGQRVVPSRPEFWAKGIQTMLDRDVHGKLERPIDGHNYLRAVVYEIAEKAWHQGNVRREEESRRRGPVQEMQGSAERPSLADEFQPVPMREAIKNWRERLNGGSE